ncbi:hypothetical protein A7X67_04540 [Clostridium sp. W14A]|nr:hypothetical protein A7X67_04540 [Clostridium sp. W14A]
MRRYLQQAGIGKRLWFLILFPASLLLTICADLKSSFAEWYATGFYSALSRTVNRMTGLVPFSIAEVLVILCFLGLPTAIILFSVGIVRKKGGRAPFALKSAINLAVFVSIVYFLFTLNCGINYYRYPFADTCGLKVQPSSQAELKKLCASLASDLNRLRPGLDTDGHGVMKLHSGSIGKTAVQAKLAYDKIEQDYPLLRSGYSAPKLVTFSRLMSRCDITGIFFPFTFEANVNDDVPEYTIPVTMCHELSHLRGYMREDEANFIGYLVCRKSGDPDFEYSGDMLAFTYANNALFSADSDAADRIYSSLDDGVRRDLSFNSAYWKQFEGPVAKVSNSVNNQYLKANRQEDGVKSYGRMVDLLLALQRANQH